jgi:hypothetical protein
MGRPGVEEEEAGNWGGLDGIGVKENFKGKYIYKMGWGDMMGSGRKGEQGEARKECPALSFWNVGRHFDADLSTQWPPM